MDTWAALGPCRWLSFQLSCLVITLDSVYWNINHTDGKTALFTYFGYSQQLWFLASPCISSLSLFIFPFFPLFHSFLLILLLTTFFLSSFFLLQAILPFFLLFYNFIQFLVPPPKYYLCYFKNLFVRLYYLISVFSSLAYNNHFWSKAPGLPNDGILRKFYCNFLINFVKYLQCLVQKRQKQQTLSLKVQVLEHTSINISISASFPSVNNDCHTAFFERCNKCYFTRTRYK